MVYVSRAAADRQAHQDPQQASPRPGRQHGGAARAHRERSEQVARELGFTLPPSAYVFSRELTSRLLAPTLVSHQFAALAWSLGCDAACTTFGT